MLIEVIGNSCLVGHKPRISVKDPLKRDNMGIQSLLGQLIVVIEFRHIWVRHEGDVISRQIFEHVDPRPPKLNWVEVFYHFKSILMRIFYLFPDGSLNVYSACHPFQLSQSCNPVLADWRIRIVSEHRLGLIAKVLLPVEVRDWAVEIVESRIFLDLLEVDFIIANRGLG